MINIVTWGCRGVGAIKYTLYGHDRDILEYTSYGHDLDIFMT